LGLAYYLLNHSLIGVTLLVDFEKQLFENDPLDFIHLGNELSLFDILRLRSGYFLDASKPQTSYFSWGGGIKLKFVTFNFARYKLSFTPAWHFDASISI